MRVAFFAFLAAFITGFSVWALSPYLTGENEPWDTHYPFYSTVLICGSAAITLATKGRWAALCVPGIWMGQLFALIALPWLDSSWWQLALVTTGIGSLTAVMGIGLGAVLLIALPKVVK